MSQELTTHTLSVLAYGLKLKDALQRDPQRFTYEQESVNLRALLDGPEELRSVADYGLPLSRPITPNPAGTFLGVRYALACWMDEIFISDQQSPWARFGNQISMESQLFGLDIERGARFWDQAEYAERGAGLEAVEAYLWCVMLGVRGVPKTVVPSEWVERAQRRIQLSHQHEFPAPPDFGLNTNTTPLKGNERYRLAVRLFAVVVAVGVCLGAAVLVAQLTSTP